MIQNCSFVLQVEEGLLGAYFVMHMGTSAITALEIAMIQRYYNLLCGVRPHFPVSFYGFVSLFDS